MDPLLCLGISLVKLGAEIYNTDKKQSINKLNDSVFEGTNNDLFSIHFPKKEQSTYPKVYITLATLAKHGIVKENDTIKIEGRSITGTVVVQDEEKCFISFKNNLHKSFRAFLLATLHSVDYSKICVNDLSWKQLNNKLREKTYGNFNFSFKLRRNRMPAAGQTFLLSGTVLRYAWELSTTDTPNPPTSRDPLEEVDESTDSVIDEDLIATKAPSAKIYPVFSRADKTPATFVFVPNAAEFWELADAFEFNPPRKPTSSQVVQQLPNGHQIIWKCPQLVRSKIGLNLDTEGLDMHELAQAKAVIQKAENLLKMNCFLQSLIAAFVDRKPAIIATMKSSSYVRQGDFPLERFLDGIPVYEVETFLERCGYPRGITVEGENSYIIPGSFSGFVKINGKFFGLTCAHNILEQPTQPSPPIVPIVIGGPSAIIWSRRDAMNQEDKIPSRTSRDQKLKSILQSFEKEGVPTSILEEIKVQETNAISLSPGVSKCTILYQDHAVSDLKDNTTPIEVGMDLILFPVSTDDPKIPEMLSQFTPMPVVPIKEVENYSKLWVKSFLHKADITKKNRLYSAVSDEKEHVTPILFHNQLCLQFDSQDNDYIVKGVSGTLVFGEKGLIGMVHSKDEYNGYLTPVCYIQQAFNISEFYVPVEWEKERNSYHSV